MTSNPEEILIAVEAHVRELRGIIIDAIGDDERFSPSLVVGAALGVAAFAAVGVGLDRKGFLQMAEDVYKHTKVPLEACVEMRAHEKRAAQAERQETYLHCLTCGWRGPFGNAARTDGMAPSCPKCHGGSFEYGQEGN